MARMMGKHEKLLSPAAMEDFFGEVYWRFGPKGLDAKAILEDFRIGSGETNFSYRSVAEKFRMIESGMVPVIVPRDEKARNAVVKTRHRRDIHRARSRAICRPTSCRCRPGAGAAHRVRACEIRRGGNCAATSSRCWGR